MLGRAKIQEAGEGAKLVDALYRKPFITKLVQPKAQAFYPLGVGGAVDLPVGWGDLDTSAGAWTLRALGWLLVAGAVTLGAPFWFDLLRRALAHRKATSESS